MRRVDFTSLKEALIFVATHGTPVEDVKAYEAIEGFEIPWGGAFGPCYQLTRLADGSYFGVEAYNNGPLSEVTPDEDFGVKVFGLVD
jgi:hypothetical protein